MTMTNQEIARVCHEANRAYCQTQGDYTQVNWQDAPQWQRDSADLGVQHIRQHPDAPASSSHQSWLEQKLRDGWKYGPQKVPSLKEHPCMVPFDQLPESQQRKDRIFGAIVRACLGWA